MNRYAELRQKQQDEFDKLPLGFALNDKQFNEMMSGWGLDPEKDTDKILRLPGNGAFIQKKDRDMFYGTINKHNTEMENAIATDETGDGFIYEMFLYELNNHEYSYTHNAEDTLDELGYAWEDIQADDRLKHGLEKAMRKIMEGADIE